MKNKLVEVENQKKKKRKQKKEKCSDSTMQGMEKKKE